MQHIKYTQKEKVSTTTITVAVLSQHLVEFQ